MNESSLPGFAPNWPEEVAASVVAPVLHAIYATVKAPEYLFLATLTAMLFRPPDRATIPFDRIGFVILVAVVFVRITAWRERIQFSGASWPMLALLASGLLAAAGQPYDASAWSVLAAKWIVPVTMFHFADVVFTTEASRRKLEWFSIAVLLYLSVTALFSLLRIDFLIFPKFILDEGIGIHADRARGPFLQAVANGVCLNILGLVALHSWERRRLGGILAAVLAVITPLALLATKTRAVWLGAGVSAMVLLLFARRRRSRWIGGATIVLGGLSLWCAVAFGSFSERLQDRSPVEFRMEMYRAAWQMLAEKPLLGWGTDANEQPELARLVSGFRPDHYVFHNTYIEVAVQRGVIGLVLYAWLFFALFRLGRTRAADGSGCLGADFGSLWRVALCVYLVNATAVVMNYQFLNGYVFTVAGVLAAREHRNVTEGGTCARRIPV